MDNNMERLPKNTIQYVISLALFLTVMILLPVKAYPKHWSDLLFIAFGFAFFALRAVEEKKKSAWFDLCCVGAILLESGVLLLIGRQLS